MPKNLRLLLGAAAALLVVALVVALTGDSDKSTTLPTATTTVSPTFTLAPTSTTTTTMPPPTTTTISPAEQQLLTLAETVESLEPPTLAAHLVVVGLTGPDVTERLEDVVGSPCVGGVFLTISNNNWAPIESQDAAARAIQDIHADSAEVGCALGAPLITTDAEFGSVVRMPVESPAAAPTWTDRYLSGSPYDVLIDLQETAAAYATDLSRLGVEVNFGTVADVATDPSFFMARSGRTFGDDPGLVAALANSVVAGHCDAGVAATLKHFPNQADTPQDPHAERSVAASTEEEWRARGRLPYIGTAAPLVMTGHIITEMDPDWPASMSHIVTTDLLRDELDYAGVIITDDLSNMRGAAIPEDSPGRRAIAAVDAGADFALFVRDTDAGAAIGALATLIQTDPEFAARARESVVRTAMLKSTLREPSVVPLCG